METKPVISPNQTNGDSLITKNKQEHPPKPGPEHTRREIFLGKWKMEGKQYEHPFGVAAKINVVESYEWLPGGFFIVHRFDGCRDKEEIACVEIIGYDVSLQSYSIYAFYNDGHTREWLLHEKDGVWTHTGEDKSMKFRCTTEFSDKGNTKTSKWEYSTDGLKWETFWDVVATKPK